MSFSSRDLTVKLSGECAVCSATPDEGGKCKDCTHTPPPDCAQCTATPRPVCAQCTATPREGRAGHDSQEVALSALRQQLRETLAQAW
jgi:hypothetical protein